MICLESCSLGCSTTGCARSDIAQNEIVILNFSEDIDPSTVTPSSIRFRTAAGNQPVGEFFVNGHMVEFVPTLSISGGQTYFGFSAGETYTMTIIGGEFEPAVVRGTSGKPFERTLSCTLASTRGIVDHNGVPPFATLVRPTPAQIGSASRSTDILIEFNELIDPTPFLSGTASPVTFSLRRTRPALGGGLECDPASLPQVLLGTQDLSFDPGRGISVLVFTPAQLLPGSVCVEVGITDQVADMSGRQAQPENFTFVTEVVPLEDRTIVEDFDNETGTATFLGGLDVESSAATWQGGTATFAKIGGDGRHGDFTALIDDVIAGTVTGATYLGVITGKRTLRFDTGATVIPEDNTTTGSALAVTDGKFFFDRMVVPADVRLRFIGSNPPVFTVVGRLDILGEIDVQGQSIAAMPVVISGVAPGQLGGAGGVFGGAGGQGGDKCTGIFPATAANNGRPGGDARVPGGHAYATSVATTGGRGSSVFPASGLNVNLFWGIPGTTPLAFCVTASAGGGGGGFLVPGSQGLVVSNNHGSPPPLLSQMGPPTAGGAALTLFPYPVAGAQKSSLHFLVGGSGGGGSASNASFALNSLPQWAQGAGGGGGGGAIALRAGDSLRLASTGRLLAGGGWAANSPAGNAIGPQVAPAGGGSGGSVVLQSGEAAEVLGLIDVRGGQGGNFLRQSNPPITPPQGCVIQIDGGDAASGFVRFEMPGTPTQTQLPGMLPSATAENVGTLEEEDEVVACRSKFYSTGLIFGPQYVHYEIHAVVDGVPTVFTDDPTLPGVPALPGAPVRALWQSATLDLQTGEPLDVRPWRTSVRSSQTQTGIASDGLNGFRFMITIDRAFAQTITIDSVKVLYRV